MSAPSGGGESGGRAARPAAWLVALLCLPCLAALPDLRSGLRAEDFLAYHYYERVPWSTVLTQPHLGTEFVSFYRPVGDSYTWAAVRLLGPAPWRHHGLLAVLAVLCALAVFGAARRLVGLGFGAALAAALVAASHPFVSSVVLYLDGGGPMALLGLFAMSSLWALGRWREGQGGSVLLGAFTIAATLSQDAGIVWPVVIVAVAALLPRVPRGVPWWLLLVAPLTLLARSAVLGAAIGGYDFASTPAALLSIAVGYVLTVPPFVAPVVAGVAPDVQAPFWSWLAPALLVALLAVGAVLGIVGRRRGATGHGVRTTLALACLCAGLFSTAALDLAFAAGHGKAFSPVLAYRGYATTQAWGLAFGWIVAGASRRVWWGSPLLVLPWVFVSLAVGATWREGFEQAGDRTTAIRDQLVERAQDLLPGQALVVFSTPLSSRVGGVGMARMLQHGLAGACRPPFLEQRLPVHPLFAFWNFETQRFESDLIARSETYARIAGSPLFAAVRVHPRRQEVVNLPADARQGAPPVTFELLWPSGTRPNEEPGAGLSAEVVHFAEDDSITLGVRGATPGTLRIVLVNPMHPFFVVHDPDRGHHLVREPGPEGGPDRLTVRAPYMPEIFRRHPDELTYALLQVTAGPAHAPTVGVSNVLPLRLAPAP